MTQDRRARPRYRLATDISVNGSAARTTDISSNSVFFETPLSLVAGDEVTLVLMFQQTGPGTLVRCSARVVRVERHGEMFGVAATYEPVVFSVSV